MRLGFGLGFNRRRRGGGGVNTAPSITSATWTAASQTLDVSVSDDGATVDIYVASVLASGGDPSKAQIEAGSGAGVVESYSTTGVSGLTGQDLGFTSASDSPLADEIHLFVRDTGGLESAIYIIETVTFDATAPSLSLPTAAANGTDGATSLGVTTDEGSGTLYWGIYPTASTPSAADVVAGTGATVNGSQAVSGTGVQAVSNQTGLTESTAYKAHYVHDDAYGNRSSVSTSAEFTTSAAASISVRAVADTGNTDYVSSKAATMPTHATDDLLLAWVMEGNGAARVQTPSGWTQVAQIAGGTDYCTLFRKIATSASETVTFTLSSSSDMSIYMMSIQGVDTTTPIPNVGTENDASSQPNTPGTVSCTAGDLGIAFAIRDRNAGFSVSPATETYEHNPANKSSSIHLYIAVEEEAGTTTTSQSFNFSAGSSSAIAFNVDAA